MTLDSASSRTERRPGRPHRPSRRGPLPPWAARSARALLGALLLLGCEKVIVEPVGVSAVAVTPSSAALVVGEQIQMHAEVRDQDGNVLSGRDVAWSSGDDGVVRINAAGMATGVGAGATTVRATVEERTGEAAITVARPVTLVLDRGSVAFSATAGGANPAPVVVRVTNGGDGDLGGLAADIAYDGSFSGWLELALASTTAPADLTVTARVGTLPAGSYAATIFIASPEASNSPASLGVTFQVQQNVPAAPSSLTVTAVTETTVALRWNDNSGDETEFRVERQAPGETAFRALTTTGPNVVAFTDAGVAVDGAYLYRVRACGPTGCSGYSNQAGATTPPVAPTNPAAVPGSSTSITVTWTDNSATETSFRIERSRGTAAFAEVGTVGAGVASFADTGLEAGVAYAYRIRACNTGGCSAYSATATATTPTIPLPAPPSALTATATSATVIELAWVDNSDDETGFQVERRAPGATAFTLLATTAANAAGYSDTGVAADGTFAYRVRACSAGGCSAYTATASATTQPVAPSALSATPTSSSRIDLAWTDNSATETGFQIERRTGTGTFAQVATAGPDVRSYADVELQPGTLYGYRVRACNAGGCSNYTAEATATTLTTPAPAAPTALTATLGAGTGPATLAWTDNSADETGFRVERSVDGATFAALATVGPNVTSLVDNGLTADHVYGYRVEACGAGGCSAFTNVATVVTIPVAASGLAATSASPTAVSLTWTDNSGTETEFRIQRRIGTGTFSQVGAVAADSTAWVDAGAAPGTGYGYRVLACNGTGCAAASGEATATTPLLAPTGLTASAPAPTAIDLAWSDANSNETEFRIERASGAGSFTEVATAPADATAFNDAGLNAGSTYMYRVRACNAVACSAYSNEAGATTGGAPAAPSGLTATTLSAAQVDLAWSDNSADETEFRVERAVDGGAFGALVTVGPDVVAYSDGTVTADHAYGYRVSACNTGACSAPTATATATTPPLAASGLTAAATSSTAITLAWTDNSATETGFRVERRTGTAAFAPVTTTAANATGYADSGLTAATSYEYRVVTCNAGGCAAPSNTATATTGDVVPAAPSGLTATTDSTLRVSLAWTDNSANETEFRIQRTLSGGAFAPLATVVAGVVAYADTTAVADRPYDYRVLTCNAAGCSAPSAPATITTAPVAPSTLSAAAASDTRIDLSWTDISATEISFQVERRTGAGSFALVATPGADATALSDAGLTPATAYTYRVRACNGGGCSAYSPEASATTLATPPPAAPTGLTATLSADETRITLGWTDASADETEFRVGRSVDGAPFAARAIVAANATTFDDMEIALDHRYAYRVEACSAAGCSAFSNEAVAATRPVAPTGLVATVASATRIDLVWTDGVNAEDEFRVERSVNGGAFAALATVGPNTPAYADLTTVQDTQYQYRVAACNAGGCSAFALSATVTTPPAPATALQAVAVSSSRIDLAWTDGSSTETEFRIERRLGGGAFAQIAAVGANVTAYSDTPLTPASSYGYRVLACNASGCAASTNVATTATLALPSAPGNVTASLTGPGQVDLTWTDNATNETRYEVDRDAGAGFVALAATLPPGTTAYSDLTAGPDASYTYRVRACDDAGCSGYAISNAVATPPVAATGLAATTVSDTEIDLAWTDASGTETEFRIERSAAGAGTFAQVGTAAANATAFADTGLTASTAYDYRVLACNAAGCAAPSNVATATTLAVP